MTGVYDLQECYAGDPLEDLARALCQFAKEHEPAVGGAFLDAYDGPIDADRLRAYVVFDRLVIWEYGVRPHVNWFGEGETFEGYVTSEIERVDACLDQYARAT
jgi:hypothetical protein